MKLSQLKSNPNNPRLIKHDKFKKLVQSIKDFPEMLEKRPIVCVTDTDGMLYPLGGNMRLKALQELKFKDIPDTWITMADDWNIEQKKEFTIKDNVGFGDWDWDTLANEWDAEDLDKWGLDVPSFATEVDYSILDEDDVSKQLEEMTDGVKKAIQIEFEAEHYEEAYALVKFWRDQKAYVGGMIMEYLKAEKGKI
jgi:ParB-like chromosome segregation protein Spo0J